MRGHRRGVLALSAGAPRERYRAAPLKRCAATVARVRDRRQCGVCAGAAGWGRVGERAGSCAPGQAPPGGELRRAVVVGSGAVPRRGRGLVWPRAAGKTDGDSTTSLGSLFQCLITPFSEVKFPNIQSKPPLVQLEAISSRPITCYLGEESDPHLSTTSFQAKQPQLPQPLLIRLLLQTLHQLRCPSLDTLQHLNVSLVVGGPKLNTVFEVRPHQCRVQGHDHFPSPAGHAIFHTSQDAIGFLGHLGTLLPHIQAAVNQHPQVLFHSAAFQPLFPKPVVLHGARGSTAAQSRRCCLRCSWMQGLASGSTGVEVLLPAGNDLSGMSRTNDSGSWTQTRVENEQYALMTMGTLKIKCVRFPVVQMTPGDSSRIGRFSSPVCQPEPGPGQRRLEVSTWCPSARGLRCSQLTISHRFLG
ncbi:hypothetical protein QYF61_020814, partial [Mycteria americana]